MNRKILYFINPVSGTREKETLKALIDKRTRQENIAFEILPTIASGDYRFAQEKIKEEKYTDVVICGGDGSINGVVHCLAETGVRFGIIPMGSGNGLALSANIPRNSNKALDIVFAGKIVPVDAFMVNSEFACMLCGLGFDAAVAHEFAHQEKRGLGKYASLTTKAFFSAKPWLFDIDANGLKFQTPAWFISIANSNQFGNNFTIAPKALLSDGLLDVVIVKKSARPLFLYHVLKQILGGKLQKIQNSMRSPVIYFQTSQLEISNPQGAPMHIDGEPRESGQKIRIKILPHFFRLIQGT